MTRIIACALILALAVSGCSTPQTHHRDTFCSSGTTLLDAHFDGGQLGSCNISDDGDFELILFPEDEPPINKSPWYAYRVSGRPGDRVTIQMQFHNGYARYWPKISLDGENWLELPPEQVIKGADDRMELTLQLQQARVWVAGGEILGREHYSRWLNLLENHEDVSTRLIGQSVQGRPIILAETADRPEFVLMIGRQHPPEVTGAIAMQTFIDTVLGDSELAQRFRQRFKLGIVPLLNPDGVAAGHWRHNVNGVDLNRDWGPFTQPESTAVIRWVQQQESDGRTLRLMLDFHSTFEDLFYTQPRVTDPPDFASLWLDASAQRLPDFPFKHAANPVSEQPNAKNYFYKSRGIPAVTYESGDETTREMLEESAAIFAEEMMKTLLTTSPDPTPPATQ
ncbi:MAG: M14-type cytosolic carboxypeptidase [Xanthomonadales bacterium]|jgi:predicted deacylase|nr:M14-type cytosolic carboxypeptidase [Xanthomonadales bacterium]MDH3924010.1 M14-type cytosolic carboxypeptidase [Xanthomonadales bacterium]MDH4002066.1 M14-type cytosolic carboxypeptidase [Xanthomonadales bacterium]